METHSEGALSLSYTAGCALLKHKLFTLLLLGGLIWSRKQNENWLFKKKREREIYLMKAVWDCEEPKVLESNEPELESSSVGC